MQILASREWPSRPETPDDQGRVPAVGWVAKAQPERPACKL